MLILLDTANLEQIKKGADIYPLDGVTTNPTIISKEKTKFIEHLKKIREIIGNDKMLHVQAVGTTAEDIVAEALYLNHVIGGNLYIKVPVTDYGIKAMKILKEKNIQITATAVITPMQALVAAKAGADFVAPYVNRIDNICGDGVKTVEEIAKIFKLYNLNCKVLAASFKNVAQIHDCCLAGSDSVTIGYDLLERLIYHPLTDWSVDTFIKDWESVYGKGTKTNDNI